MRSRLLPFLILAVGFVPGLAAAGQVTSSRCEAVLAKPYEIAEPSTPNPAGLEPAMSSFGIMRLAVRPGQHAVVTLDSGETVEGRIAYASDASIGLDVDGTRRAFDEDEVCRVESWKRFRVMEGLGMGVGAVLMPALLDWYAGAKEPSASLGIAEAYGRHPIRVAKATAIGAGIGMLLTRVLPGRRILAYEKNTIAEPPALGVSPILSSELKGVAVSIGWK